MMWLWVGVGLACALCLAGLFYWQLVVAEGAYLGPEVVAWTYDKVADRYDGIKQFDPHEESWYVAGPLLRTLAVIEHPLVLDVATGTGRLPLALLRNQFAGEIIGLDLSSKMLRVARTKLSPFGNRVGLIWHDARCLPFEDGVFDAVTCLEALEFLPSPLESLAEIVRVLAPGGLVFVTNRVGFEAHLLPGHTVRRSEIGRRLTALGLGEIDVRRWQVSYDLVMARKEGRQGVRKRARDWRSMLLCPHCGQPLAASREDLSCTACGARVPLDDGIVLLATRS